MAQNVDIELVIKAGQSAQTLGEIKQSVKDVTEALKNVKVGTEEFERLKEVFQQNRANVKAMRQEFAELKQVENVAKTLTSSFAAASASISLFAGENTKAEKAVRQLEGAFVLMESVQKLGRAFREAQIANETFNKSLLTNPYVLIATALIGIGLAIYAYTNDAEAAEKATEKLAESAQRLNEVKLDEFKAAIEKYTEKQQEAIDNAQQELDILIAKKATDGQILAAKQKLYDLEKTTADTIVKSSKEIADKEIENFDKKQTAYQKTIEMVVGLKAEESELAKISFNTKAQDERLIQLREQIKGTETWLKLEKDRLAVTKERVETLKKNEDKSDKSDKKKELAEVEAGEKRREETLAKNHEAELKRLKEIQEKHSEERDSDDKTLELLKAQGKTEAQVANLQLQFSLEEKKANEESISGLEKKIEANKKLLKAQGESTLEGKKTKSDIEAETEVLKTLNKERENLIQKIALTRIEQEKLTKEGNEKLALKEVENLTNALERNKIERKQITDIAIASGKEQSDTDKMKIADINKEIDEQTKLWTVVKQSNITDVEKKKRTDDISKALGELNRQQQLLQAGIAKQSKNPFFSDKQLKDIQKYVSYVKEAEKVVGKFMDAITQNIQQNVDARIAMYQHENDTYTTGLKASLDSGFISQREYNKKKADADKELAKKKQEENHKAFVAHKTTAIITATIDTALAVVNALATAPTYIAGIVFAALAGAAGAVEIGTIAAQKEPPAFAKGGMFSDGGSVVGLGTGTSDSINAKLSNGESVINAKSTKAFAPLLSAINQIGGGVSFQGQKPIQNTPTGVAPNTAQPQASSAPQKVFVSEYDITRTQNKISVIQSRSTF